MTWDQPVTPICPVSCCFRETCSEGTQRRAEPLWTLKKILKPADCPSFAHRADMHHALTGYPAPNSVAELLRQLGEIRRAPAGEDSPFAGQPAS